MARSKGESERDTCREVVLPALAASGWADEQIRPEYPVKAGRVLTSGGIAKNLGDGRVDYVLEAVPGVPVAVVEAKREYRAPGDGMGQALRYTQQLDVPVAYSTNGRGIVEHDLATGTERDLDAFATPAELWSAFQAHHGLDGGGAALVGQAFNRKRVDIEGNVIQPRWYQTVAVHRVLRAIATGSRRVLLLMATGTGKTFTAMQIVAKLRAYEAVARPDRTFRVLYLADLDALLTQPSGDVTATACGEDDEASAPEDGSVAEPDPGFQPSNPDGPAPPDPPPAPVKLFVDDGDFHVVAEAVQVPDTSTGRLRLTEYGEHVKGVVRSIATSADAFAARWARSPSRTEIMEELAGRGVTLAELSSGRTPTDTDPLDVLLQVAWNVPARTRAERARRVREAHGEEIAGLSTIAQQVLAALLDRYAVHGIDDVTSGEVLHVPSLRRVGSPVEIAREFGGPDGWHDQLDRLQG